MCLREAAVDTARLGQDDIICAQAGHKPQAVATRPCPLGWRRENSFSCQGCVLLSAGRSPPTPLQRADRSGVPSDAMLPLLTPGSGVSCCCLWASPNPQLPAMVPGRTWIKGGKVSQQLGTEPVLVVGWLEMSTGRPDGLGLNAAPALEGCPCTLRGCFPHKAVLSHWTSEHRAKHQCGGGGGSPCVFNGCP